MVKKLLTLYKLFEKRFPLFGEDLLLNMSCQRFVKTGKLCEEDLLKVSKYARFRKLGMNPKIYYHYL